MNNIKILREKHNLNQSNIAKFLNINQSSYSDYETEESNIPLSSLILLSIKYKTSLDYLLGITNNPTRHKLSPSNDILELINKQKNKELIGNKLFIVKTRIKELRKENNINQKEFAKLFSLTQPIYSRYENGKRKVPNDLLIKFANYYNVSIDYLVGLTNTKNKY